MRSAVQAALLIFFSFSLHRNLYITLLYTYLILGEYDKAGLVSKNQLADYYPFDDAIRDYSRQAKGECEAMTKDGQASAQAGVGGGEIGQLVFIGAVLPEAGTR